MSPSHAGVPTSAGDGLPQLPWPLRDLLRLGGMTAAGALGLVVAWYGASEEARAADQFRWLTLAVLAAAVAALGMVGWLARGLRQVRRTARAGVGSIASSGGIAGAREPWRARRLEAEQVATSSGWVASPAMTRYHFPGCQLVHGKADLRPVAQGDIGQRRLHPCGVCVDG